MPIDSRSRPIGVTLLGLMAFAFSPVFIILLADFFYHIFVENIAPSATEGTGAFLWLCFWLMVLTTCF
jgi:hypothetical protein